MIGDTRDLQYFISSFSKCWSRLAHVDGLDNGLDFFTKIFIRHAEHSHVHYLGMGGENIFGLLRIDVDAPGNDNKRLPLK